MKKSKIEELLPGLKPGNEQTANVPTSIQTIAKPHVIRWLGECIFPQSIVASAEKFGEDAIIACINEGLIVRSRSKIGSDPAMMYKPKGYMELSDKGWDEYKKLTGEAIV